MLFYKPLNICSGLLLLCSNVDAQQASNAKLPDPFHFVDGSAVTSKSQWDTRREEINQLYQNDEAGTFPPKPSTFSATFASNILTITCSEGGKPISFTASIKYPSSGQVPYPAIIGYGGGSIPAPAGVAMINYNNLDLAADATTRGGGKFYTLYGTSTTAGAEAAWAWGASRILDALEITPGARINPERVGITGCSRYGKGAFMAGALEPRYALTIPQESGVSGSGCWRLAADLNKNGQSVEAAGNLAMPNTNWLCPAFDTFAKAINTLPFDHHMIAGMIAPRGLYVIDNLDYVWLGPESNFGCMTAAQEIYKSLGATSSMGYSAIGGHAHCAFDSRQQSELTAFVNRFLLDKDVDTTVINNGGGFTFDKSKWINWTTPTLT